MQLRQTVLSVLLASSFAFPQINDGKSSTTTANPGASSQPSTSLITDPCQSRAPGEAEILTDTMGVDFGPYLTDITQILRKNWHNVLPPSVYPPILKQGKLSIDFFILKDGKVAGIAVHTPSGDVALDRAAWTSITTSNPFPPLPTGFPGQNLGLRFYYFYNLKVHRINISPCANVRVLAGSTVKFSASVKGITDANVKWSISGSGCSQLACGTISDDGLYTAPLDIPKPPTVLVEAESPRPMGSILSGRTKLTVVEASSTH